MSSRGATRRRNKRVRGLRKAARRRDSDFESLWFKAVRGRARGTHFTDGDGVIREFMKVMEELSQCGLWAYLEYGEATVDAYVASLRPKDDVGRRVLLAVYEGTLARLEPDRVEEAMFFRIRAAMAEVERAGRYGEAHKVYEEKKDELVADFKYVANRRHQAILVTLLSELEHCACRAVARTADPRLCRLSVRYPDPGEAPVRSRRRKEA